MRLTSAAFAPGGQVPVRFTCDGADVPPPLAWTDPPAAVRSFVLVCSDPDAPGGTFYHWAIYDIPHATQALDEHWPAVGPWPQQATNDFGRRGYSGPCPPPGATHRYVFRLYAVDAERLQVGARRQCRDVEAAAAAHAVATAELVGVYGRR
ncbi:MAG TPA: YbhB/YbcL family Raf kinase inhibitor-like protein [Acidisphaera sp.]|nr:YbhB/YbcL family Raf kinase inhibitor-like protein [Acidisphaera sp.]